MNAWTMTKKDLAIFFRDRVGLLLGIALPLALATVFGAAMGAMGGDGGGMGRARLYVEDRDGSPASKALVRALQASDTVSVRLVDVGAVDAGNEESAREHVADGDGPAGLLIERGYGAAARRADAEGDAAADEGTPGLVLLRDPGKAIEQQLVAAALMPALFEVSGERLGKRAMHQSLDWLDFPGAGRAQADAVLDDTWERISGIVAGLGGQADEDEAGDAAAADASPGATSSPAGFDLLGALTDVLGLETEDVVGGDEKGSAAQKAAGQAHAVAGIAVMMLLFGLTACGGTLLDEEAEGTLDRLRLAPGASRAILGGKFLFTWLVGLLQLAILFVYGSLLFDIPVWRAPVALLVLSSAVAAAATGFGVLFAVLCRTRKQLEGLSTIVILTMSAMGGSWFPLVITPDWYRAIGHFTLTAWAMDGYQALFWYGQGLADILPEIGVLLAIGAATSLAAVLLWNRRERA